MGKNEPLIPAWVCTVGAMRAEGVRVRWSCQSCRQWGDVDLARVEEAKGDDFSLINRRPRCRQPGCAGRVLLLYSPGGGTPFRPLAWGDSACRFRLGKSP